MIFFIFKGPSLPKALVRHEMVRIGYDLIVLGGSNGEINSGALYKLSCTNYNCKWESLSQELKIPRNGFVAIPVPDDFVTCN